MAKYVVIGIILFFTAYGTLIHWRPHATEGLFSIEWIDAMKEE
jgi:hypothetical protein